MQPGPRPITWKASAEGADPQSMSELPRHCGVGFVVGVSGQLTTRAGSQRNSHPWSVVLEQDQGVWVTGAQSSPAWAGQRQGHASQLRTERTASHGTRSKWWLTPCNGELPSCSTSTAEQQERDRQPCSKLWPASQSSEAIRSNVLQIGKKPLA